jgi:hypothetical protein
MLLRLACVLLSLLPIPVITFSLLPTYQAHARFLLFYAPLICFLLLGYLLYIRGLLGHAMFAEVLDPAPERDPYYRERAGDVVRRSSRRIVRAALGLLPLMLLAVSLFCVTRYIGRLNDSVALASQVLLTRLPLEAPDDSAATGDGKERKARAAADTAAHPGQQSETEARLAALRRLPGLSTDPNPLRTYTLTMATIDDIPYFAELTAWFIGTIAAALAGVLLVLLKEHARSTLGMSEGELLEGGRSTVEPSLEASAGERFGS